MAGNRPKEAGGNPAGLSPGQGEKMLEIGQVEEEAISSPSLEPRSWASALGTESLGSIKGSPVS